jgi:hypothetical protein
MKRWPKHAIAVGLFFQQYLQAIQSFSPGIAQAVGLGAGLNSLKVNQEPRFSFSLILKLCVD